MLCKSLRSWDEVRSNASFHPLLPAIAETLACVCSANDALACAAAAAVDADIDATPVVIPAFEAMWPAGVSVQDFLIRLCKYAGCSPSIFALAAVHVDRVSRRIRLTSCNVHRIFLAAFVCAAKFADDRRVAMQHYASIAGVSRDGAHALEAAFLTFVDWRLCATADEVSDAGVARLTYGGAAAVADGPPSLFPVRAAAAEEPGSAALWAGAGGGGGGGYVRRYWSAPSCGQVERQYWGAPSQPRGQYLVDGRTP